MGTKNQSERFSEVRNSKALRDYFIEERFEAGIVLRGSEVKSVRSGHAQMADSFGRIEKGEVWLHNLHIDEYANRGYITHDPRRVRKLLLHRHQIRKITQALETGGKTLVGLRMYFKEALLKVEVGIGQGKQMHDKRADIKEREDRRSVDRMMRARR